MMQLLPRRVDGRTKLLLWHALVRNTRKFFNTILVIFFWGGSMNTTVIFLTVTGAIPFSPHLSVIMLSVKMDTPLWIESESCIRQLHEVIRN